MQSCTLVCWSARPCFANTGVISHNCTCTFRGQWIWCYFHSAHATDAFGSIFWNTHACPFRIGTKLTFTYRSYFTSKWIRSFFFISTGKTRGEFQGSTSVILQKILSYAPYNVEADVECCTAFFGISGQKNLSLRLKSSIFILKWWVFQVLLLLSSLNLPKTTRRISRTLEY